ncbi:MAG: hypothetical protein ACI4XQ_08985 [Eubacteriales bacterium]|nr:hypothetical protein [Clostridiales bacterium]
MKILDWLLGTQTPAPEDELYEALKLWEDAGEALVTARHRFNSAQSPLETEAAIHEMGAAEAKRSQALTELRSLLPEGSCEEQIPCKYTIPRR